MIPVRAHLTVQTNINNSKLEFQSNTVDFNANSSTTISPRLGPYFAGPYTVTPSQSTQTLNTDDLRMTDNVTINPIPSNYGLITWNGSVLTVS